jgi:hypothetical protein
LCLSKLSKIKTQQTMSRTPFQVFALLSLTPEGKKLEAHYSKMLADLKPQITRREPKVEEKK